MDWTIERAGPVCARVKIPYRKAADWEQWVLVSSDEHFDNPHSDRELHKLHLDQAKERGAIVCKFGDFFDAMQGKSDRRSSKRDLRQDLAESRSYLNQLVEESAAFLEPYSANLALISEGNHETSVDNKIEYNLLDGLLYALSHRGGEHIIRGGYRGWIKFHFHAGDGGRMTKNAYYLHGSGGGGPVTKGVIQTNRRAVYLSNADYVFSGHIHEQWYMPIERVKLLENGREVQITQHHLQLPTYKQEFIEQGSGWHHETGKPPKPLGAWWIRFYYSSRSGGVREQFIPADV